MFRYRKPMVRGIPKKFSDVLNSSDFFTLNSCAFKKGCCLSCGTFHSPPEEAYQESGLDK
jgi:hypothetical protein